MEAEIVPNVEDDCLRVISHHGGQIVRILLVPGEPQEGGLVLGFKDDGRMLQAPTTKY